MTLWSIARKDLQQRKIRSLLVMLVLAIGISSITGINALMGAMNNDMADRMSDLGPNLLITGDTGDITFSYGGITLPGMIVRTKHLTQRDLDVINQLRDRGNVSMVVPKLIAHSTTFGREAMIAGTDIRNEFAIKPWLRIVNYLAKFERMSRTTADPNGMSAEPIDLAREDPAMLDLGNEEVILGAGVAFELGLYPTNHLTIEGQDFTVKAVLEKNGTEEDHHILMNLARAQEILGRPDQLTIIEMAVDFSDESERGFLDLLAAKLPHASITKLGKAGADQSQIMLFLEEFGLLVSMMILLTALIAAGYGMSAAITERTREIGIFRAIGLPRHLMIRMILMQAGLLSAVGGILGYGTGMLAARALIPLLIGPGSVVRWQPDVMFLSLSLAMLVGLASGVYPAYRATGMEPMDALRQL